jgi:neurotransmitter:Na+ symporter, NSS family
MQRASWGSRIGFILAVAGSAVGLGNIWRFPYIVGQNGGAAFILVYFASLLLIGFPVFMSEILIGRATQTSPSGAFALLGGKIWGLLGKMTIITGFIVSAFYSAVAGWILGYLIESIKGNVSSFPTSEAVLKHHKSLMDNPLWGLSFHLLFLLICVSVLLLGVRRGIEKGNKIMMPLLFVVLIFLAIKGLGMPDAQKGISFLLSPDWSALTPAAFLIALGHAFFTLSLGQGTMVTYGSYLDKNSNLLANCFPVIIVDTLISLTATIAIFTIVFSTGLEANSGPALIFHTLPWVFSQVPLGHGLAVLFFLLVVLAAITSEISAMEPTIAYLIDDRGWRRTPAVLTCGLAALIVGIPSALSYSLLKNNTLWGMTFLDLMDFSATAILIPLGGLCAVVLVGWKWGFTNALAQLRRGAEPLFDKYPILTGYFWFCFKYSAPILIVLVLLNALQIL